MASGTDHIEQKSRAPGAFSLILGLGILTTLLALAIYGYLGTFSRYGSDDYCLSAFFYEQGGLFKIMAERYVTSSSRYTNILFIGLVDRVFGWYNVAVLPALMIALFVWGTYLFLKEIARLASLGWSRLLTLFLAALVVYFSVMQAPSLYETLYWRAGMTSHFAPLVFLTFLGAFLVKEIRLARERFPALWKPVILFLAAFVLGGFSEPPVALAVTVLMLALFAVWLWDRSPARRARFVLLLCPLAGFLVALAVLALAPANSIRLETAPPGLPDLVIRTLKYPFEFIADVFRSLPLSSLITFLLPAVLFYAEYSRREHAGVVHNPRRLGLIFFAVILLSYLLTAASFAPSVYGQSFPVARARFAGRLILTCALMVNGALIGILAANIRTRLTAQVFLSRFAILTLMLLTLYPLRTASRMAGDIPAYRQRAQAWDARDAQIRAFQADGVRDLTVPFLPDEISQDLGDYTEFRLNRCASVLYGVDSILVLPTDGQ